MNKNRLWIFLILLALAAAPLGAFAAEDEMPETMFTNAKEALSLMSYGEYEKALEIIAFSSNEPTVEDFKFFADASFTMLEGGVQKDVAVACLTDEYGWLLAVPLWEPDAMDIDTFVLHSSDGLTFDNYTSTQWSFISDLLTKSTKVIWHEAYEPGEKYILPD